MAQGSNTNAELTVKQKRSSSIYPFMTSPHVWHLPLCYSTLRWKSTSLRFTDTGTANDHKNRKIDINYICEVWQTNLLSLRPIHNYSHCRSGDLFESFVVSLLYTFLRKPLLGLPQFAICPSRPWLHSIEHGSKLRTISLDCQ